MAVYDVSVTDSFSGWGLGGWGSAGWGQYAAGATDAPSLTAVVSASASETSASSDVVSAPAGVLNASSSETIASSSLQIFAFAFPVALTDSALAGDVSSKTVIVYMLSSESAAATEQASAFYAPMIVATSDLMATPTENSVAFLSQTGIVEEIFVGAAEADCFIPLLFNVSDTARSKGIATGPTPWTDIDVTQGSLWTLIPV